MEFGSINWLLVIVCTIVSMVIGALWYNPKTFFIPWWKAMGKGDYMPGGAGADGAQMDGAGASVWILTIASAFVRALFLSVVIRVLGGTTLISGVTAGFLLWLGLVAPTTLINKLFADHLKSWYYETGDHLVTLVVIGAIVGLWA